MVNNAGMEDRGLDGRTYLCFEICFVPPAKHNRTFYFYLYCLVEWSYIIYDTGTWLVKMPGRSGLRRLSANYCWGVSSLEKYRLRWQWCC